MGIKAAELQGSVYIVGLEHISLPIKDISSSHPKFITFIPYPFSPYFIKQAMIESDFVLLICPDLFTKSTDIWDLISLNFASPLEFNPVLCDFLASDPTCPNPELISFIPINAIFHTPNKDQPTPVFNLNNLYISTKFETSLLDLIKSTLPTFPFETSITVTDPLQITQHLIHKYQGIHIKINKSNQETQIKISSLSKSNLETCIEFSRKQIINTLVIKIPHLITSRYNDAIECIENAIQRFGSTHLALSFNGGKDCTVLLELFMNCLKKYNITDPIKAVYVVPANPFIEIEEFVDSCVKRYNLDLMRVEGPMKQGLSCYLKQNRPVHAILIGTRLNDPFSSSLKTFMKTDPGWPECIRVHPILEWEYKDVWDFLRGMNVPYCCLYDQGFTSIDGTANTLPNPYLRNTNRYCGFDPAYKLLDGSKERLGRTNKSTK